MSRHVLGAALFLALACGPAVAQTVSPAVKNTAPTAAPADPALAKKLGADAMGMRQYVFVLLKTGPNKVPKGPARDAMFKGHFANMQRLADAGKLVMAGPFDGKDGWRGLFVFAVTDIEEARKLVASDPVIVEGEMVAEYHTLYASAAVMQVGEIHKQIETTQP